MSNDNDEHDRQRLDLFYAAHIAAGDHHAQAYQNAKEALALLKSEEQGERDRSVLRLVLRPIWEAQRFQIFEKQHAITIIPQYADLRRSDVLAALEVYAKEHAPESTSWPEGWARALYDRAQERGWFRFVDRWLLVVPGILD